MSDDGEEEFLGNGEDVSPERTDNKKQDNKKDTKNNNIIIDDEIEYQWRRRQKQGLRGRILEISS